MVYRKKRRTLDVQHPTRTKKALTVTLKSFRSGAALDLLDEWLHEPHVRKWWGDPERNLNCVKETPPHAHSLIITDGRAVGYVRWQPVSLPDLAALGINDIPEGSIDIDILIGEPELVGKGIGSRALQILLSRLRRRRSISLAGMSTSVENRVAIRAYEKAGFQRRHRYYDPEYGESWIMTLDL